MPPQFALVSYLVHQEDRNDESSDNMIHRIDDHARQRMPRRPNNTRHTIQCSSCVASYQIVYLVHRMYHDQVPHEA